MSRSPGRRSLRTLGIACLALAPVAASFSLAAAPAQAAGTQSYLVTFVARQCPTYQDITANLARNNIQESLQDLGADTAYTSGQPISPSVETPHQPNCTALTGWDFTFGNGINGKTPGTNLSRVSNPVSPPFTTQATTPLLDVNGNPTGSTIAGAVTTTLTSAQVTQASNHQLWVQGGTATDPLGTATFGTRYAFGALRCAIDNLNGDNVEWVGFPSGQSHVFCYYYAVDQKPQPGVITIAKTLTGQGSTTPTFPFTGSVSYNPGGAFSVNAGSSVSFTRDSNVDWNFQEQGTAGYSFTRIDCSSRNADSTFSANGSVPATSATFLTNDLVTVNLAPSDVATCTYTNARNATDITVLKQTVGGVGGPFPFTVETPSHVTTDLSATTTEEGVPVEACPTATVPPCDVPDTPLAFPADYLVSEIVPPATGAGSWAVTAFDCNGIPQTPATPVGGVVTQTVVVTTNNESMECTFTDTFTPTASITITKTTTGSTGTTEFDVTPVTGGDGASDVADPVYSATTTTAGVAAVATQVSGDYSLDALDLGQYSIVETGPDDTAGGTWAPKAITCNGTASDPTASDVLVTLTAGDPHVTCAFTNAFTATPPPTTTTTTTTVPSSTTTTHPSSSTTSTTVAGQVAADQTGVSGGTGGTAGALALTGINVRLPIGVAVALLLVGLTLLSVERVRRRLVPVVVVDEETPTAD